MNELMLSPAPMSQPFRFRIEVNGTVYEFSAPTLEGLCELLRMKGFEWAKVREEVME